jgi:hypothetical protein
VTNPPHAACKCSIAKASTCQCHPNKHTDHKHNPSDDNPNSKLELDHQSRARDRAEMQLTNGAQASTRNYLGCQPALNPVTQWKGQFAEAIMLANWELSQKKRTKKVLVIIMMTTDPLYLAD